MKYLIDLARLQTYSDVEGVVDVGSSLEIFSFVFHFPIRLLIHQADKQERKDKYENSNNVPKVIAHLVPGFERFISAHLP